MNVTDYAARANSGNSDRSASTGLGAFLAATTMLFAALTSAYVVRRGLAGDWTPLSLPILVPGTVLLLVLSSLALERGRRNFRAHRQRAFARAWFSGAGAGILFVLTLGYAWMQLRQTGISVASSPAAAFFCVLAGTFVLFVTGTTVAVIWLGLRAHTSDSDTAHNRLRLVTRYWHYLDALWIYLVVLLYARS